MLHFRERLLHTLGFLGNGKPGKSRILVVRVTNYRPACMTEADFRFTCVKSLEDRNPYPIGCLERAANTGTVLVNCRRLKILRSVANNRSARRHRMVREDAGCPSKGASCACMSTDEEIGCTRALLTVWRCPRRLVYRGRSEPGHRINDISRVHWSQHGAA
ncbi:uncharacterized protein TNCV_1609791 [Trichonephila clavipes]|nr:uncharacterized protein TNCV_1609791 [Trichonephila clavipes]